MYIVGKYIDDRLRHKLEFTSDKKYSIVYILKLNICYKPLSSFS